MTKVLAYAWANGQVGFGEAAPHGALPIGVGETDRIKAQCRLAHDGETYLVPGVPEASNQMEGADALMVFRNRLHDLGIIERKPRGGGPREGQEHEAP